MRRLREQRGWSQSAVATKLAAFHGIELHFSAIAKMEAANRLVRLNEAVALAEIFEVQLADMLLVTGIEMDYAEMLEVFENEKRTLEAKLLHVNQAQQRVRDRAAERSRREDEWVGEYLGSQQTDRPTSRRPTFAEKLREVATDSQDED